jgi:tripartite-type tricarboxylate transporter receptor subunit TctC
MFKPSKLVASLFCSLLAVAGLASQPAHAEYPDKPIRMIVPFPPGGTVDLMGRLASQMLTDALGQSVVVENYGGAGGAIGGQRAAHSPPDGYTLAVGSTSTLSINPFFMQVGYEPLKDFTPITLMAFVPHVLVVNKDLPVSNLKEFLAYAKAHDGKLNFGSSGIGTPHHVAGEMFNELTGLHIVHVPYKGTAPALSDVLSGRLAMMSVELDIARPYIQSGQIKVLGIATQQRNPAAPDIPTVEEAGLKGFLVTSWYGIVGPAGMPKPIVDKLSATLAKALAQPATRDKLLSMGATPVGGTPAEFGKFLVTEKAKWNDVITKGNVVARSQAVGNQ